MMPNSFKFNGISELLHIEVWAIYVVKLEKTSDYDDEAPGCQLQNQETTSLPPARQILKSRVDEQMVKVDPSLHHSKERLKATF